MLNSIFILTCSVINLFIGGGTFFVVSYTSTWILTKLVGSEGAGFAALGLVLVAFFIGLLAALLSLIPSYKLCMKMAEKLRFRGWPLTHPRRLFALALTLLILPIILLMLSGIVFGA